MSGHEQSFRPPNPNAPSIVVGGRVLTGEELRKYARKHGLCDICGQYQTHRKVTSFLRNQWEPITTITPDGVTTVYKGHCIQPTCYPSVDHVKGMLGEKTQQSHRHHKLRQSMQSSGGVSLAPSLMASSTASTSQMSGTTFYTAADGASLAGTSYWSGAPTPLMEDSSVTEFASASGSTVGPPGTNPSYYEHSALPPGAASYFGPPGTAPPGHPQATAPRSSPQTSLDSRKPPAQPIAAATLGRDTSGHSTSSAPSQAMREIPLHPAPGGQQQREIFFSDNSSSASSQGDNGGGRSQGVGTVAVVGEVEEVQYTNPILKDLYKAISDRDYILFLNTLEEKATEPEIAIEGFKLFCRFVVRDQRSRPEAVIVPGGEWAKTLKRNMARFPADKTVAVQGMLTVITLADLHEKYKRAMIKKGVLDTVVTIMKHHHEDRQQEDSQVLDLITSFFYILTVDDKSGINPRTKNAVIAIRKMGEIIQQFPEEDDEKKLVASVTSRRFACRTLWNLAHQQRRQGETLADDVQTVLTNGGGGLVQGLVVLVSSSVGKDGVLSGTSSLSALSASVGLLQMCIFPSGSSESGSSNSLVENVDVRDSLLNSLVTALQSQPKSMDKNTISCLDACCGLLANVGALPSATRQGSDNGYSPVVLAVSKMLSVYFPHQATDESKDIESDFEGLALSGMHATCNWLSKPLAAVTDNRSGQVIVTAALQCLSQYPQNAKVQELSCITLACACRTSANARFAVDQGVMDKIDATLKNHGALFEPGEKRNQSPHLQVRKAALSVMVALVGCRSSGAIQKVVGERLDQMAVLLAMEQNPEAKNLLQSILDGCQQPAGGSSVADIRMILKENPERLAPTMQSLDSDETALDAMRELQSWMSDEDIGLSAKLSPFLSDQSVESILEGMGSFIDSAEIQEAGCGVLSEIFCHLPYRARQDSNAAHQKSWALNQVQAVIDTVQHAMERHGSHAGAQSLACLALSNFLCPLCEEISSGKSFVPDEIEVIRALLDRSWKDVSDAMSSNADNRHVQKHAIRLFWTLSLICPKESVKGWTQQTGHQIFSALQRFPSDSKLIVAACDALISLQDNSEALDVIGSKDKLGQLATIVLASTDDDALAAASAVLASTLKKSPLASARFLEIQDIIESLVVCMKNEQSYEARVGAILQSLSAVQDGSAAQKMYKAGGLEACCDALSNLGHNERIAEDGVRVMASIVGAADSNAISSIQSRLGRNLFQTMQNHPKNGGIQSSVVKCLRDCCSKDESFQNLLVNDVKFADFVVEAMNDNLHDVDLQQDGCGLIRSMSPSSKATAHYPKSLGEKGAVKAVVNCMSAHCEDATLQKEALRTLKVLATIPRNKPIISDVGGEQAVMNALWTHSQDPRLASSAMSALNNIIVEPGKPVGRLSEDSMKAIVLALSRFKDDEIVQKQGCFLLNSSSYSEFNLNLMREQGKELLRLLSWASDKFPDQCRSLAMAVASKVGKVVTVEPESIDRSMFDQLTLLQASPLVYEVNGTINVQPMPRRDFSHEIALVQKSLQVAGAVGGKIGVDYQSPTVEGLSSFFNQDNSSPGSRVLHLSCSAHPRYLALEDGSFKLKTVALPLPILCTPPRDNKEAKVVFVSSCQARLVGQALVSAGISHVVCCFQTDPVLRDPIADEFTRVFYERAAQGRHLQEAFTEARDAAKRVALETYGSQEAVSRQRMSQRFALLPATDELDEHHRVPVFFARSQKPPWKAAPLSIKTWLPPFPRNMELVGRELELYQVLCEFQRPDSYAVHVWGPPQSGKHRFTAALCQLIAHRHRSLDVNHICWFPPPPPITASSRGSGDDSQRNEKLCTAIWRVLESALASSSELSNGDSKQQGIEERLDEVESILDEHTGKTVIVIDEPEIKKRSTNSTTSYCLRRLVDRLLTRNSHIKLLQISGSYDARLDTERYLSSMTKHERGNILPVRLGGLDASRSALLFGQICPWVAPKGPCRSCQSPGELAARVVDKATIQNQWKRAEVFRRMGGEWPGSIIAAAESIDHHDFVTLVDILFSDKKEIN